VRRIVIVLGLALLLLGCSGQAPRGEQVPLLTTDGASTGASFVNWVIDVVADPETGTPIIEIDGAPAAWPTGYTAWRVGSETEILDLKGDRVLVTGQRYRFYPSNDLLGSEPEPGRPIPGPYRIIAYVQPCPLPWTCVLGFHPQDNL
jgi:hypothetical protein